MIYDFFYKYKEHKQIKTKPEIPKTEEKFNLERLFLNTNEIN